MQLRPIKHDLHPLFQFIQLAAPPRDGQGADIVLEVTGDGNVRNQAVVVGHDYLKPDARFGVIVIEGLGEKALELALGLGPVDDAWLEQRHLLRFVVHLGVPGNDYDTAI